MASSGEDAAPPAPVLLEFDMGGGGKARPPPRGSSAPGKHDKPWRKPAKDVKEERAKSSALLGGAASSGVDEAALRYMLAAQELVDASEQSLPAVQAACTELLQLATNARPAAEVEASRAAVEAAAAEAGKAAELSKRVARANAALAAAATPSASGGKLQLLHEVIPRLWVGGWTALNNECLALKQRKVTHVVSVISSDRRQLPDWIQGHHYVRVDDSEEAANTLARRRALVLRARGEVARVVSMRSARFGEVCQAT